MAYQRKCSISISPGGVHKKNVKQFTSDQFLITWTGLVYNDQGISGEALMQEVLQALEVEKAIDEIARGLRGSFFIVLEDKRNSTIYAFVDDSALFTAYRGPNAAAISFLELCRTCGISSDSFSKAAMLEFMQLGNVYFSDTLSDQIKKIEADEILVFSPQGLRIETKGIERLHDGPHYHDMVEATAPLAKVLADHNVSVDLTGGFDSRMVAALMTAHNLPIETALSGSLGVTDMLIGQQVAAALSCPFYFAEYDGQSIVEDLEAVLQLADGMGGSILSLHRLLDLNRDRMARGVTVSLKGSGGELYKDFFWTQDFPFYRSRKTHMARLHRLRIELELLTPHVLTPEAYDAFLTLRDARVRRLTSRYQEPFNTQTYDNVYFYERMQTWNARTITSTQDANLSVHSPLSELKLAQLGFHAPRHMRFYNRYHRRVITATSPKAAKVMTTDGTTASSFTADIVKDSFGYIGVKSKKLSRKIAQLLLNKTIFTPAEHTPNTDQLSAMAESEIGQSSLDALKERELLRPETEYGDISSRFRANLIALGWTLNRLK